MGIVTDIRNRLTRKYTLPPGAIATPIDQQKLMAAMQAASAPQKDNASAFSPGSPLLPSPGITLPQGPRAWQFPVGYNIGQLPRATEATSFQTLRNLASLYDGIQLCKQPWFDLCSRLDIEIKPTDDALAQAGGDASVFADDIARYKAWFEMPDKDEDLDLSNWIVKALGEQLDLDALAIYVHPDRAGRPYSLEIIAGETIKPLIDARGRKPQPPYPAFQQYWYGVPLGWYTKDQMIYHRETQRADSVYGLSRVERIIMRVNQALRKQNKDLARFTEGNLPPGILEMPETDDEWTPDQILVFQQIWDGLLSGNDKTRSRLKVVPPGSKFTAIQDQDIMTAFDTFLLNTAAAAFGLTMAELGFTENVNKSSGESQENVIYRRAMRPLMNRFAKLFTLILRKYFHETRFYVTFKGFEESEDLKSQFDAYSEAVNNGLLTVEQAAKALNLPFDEETAIPRFQKTATGPVFFEDLLDPQLREAQKQAKLAGLQQAQQLKPPQMGQQPPQEGEDDDDEQKPPPPAKGKPGTVPGTSSKSKANAGTAKPDSDDETTGAESADTGTKGDNTERAVSAEPPAAPATADDASYIWRRGSCTCESCTLNNGVVRKAGESFPSGATNTGTHDACDCTLERIDSDVKQETLPQTTEARHAAPGHTSGQESDGSLIEAKVDLRRWRSRSIDDIKRGRAFRDFTSEYIDVQSRQNIHRGLRDATSVEDVKRVFDLERVRTADPSVDSGSWQDDFPGVQETLDSYEKRGVVELEWDASGGACDECQRNHGARVKPGKPFPTGAYMTPNHNGCQCVVKEYFADGSYQVGYGLGSK